jgi:CheY-like chemotaxis protein
MKILVVDDDDRDRATTVAAVRGVLDARRPFVVTPDVREARNYEEALQAIVQETWDLVLLDLQLTRSRDLQPSQLEGLWLLDDMRELGCFPLTDVWIVSAFANLGLRNDLTDMGFKIDVNDQRADIPLRLPQHLDTAHDYGAKTEVQFDGWDGGTVLTELLGTRFFDRITSIATAPETQAELVHLFRRSFADCSEVTLSRLGGGATASGVVRCDRRNRQGQQVAGMVAKFALADAVRDESERAGALEPFVGASRATSLKRCLLGRHLGVATYSLVGLASEAMRDLGTLIEDEPPAGVRATDSLFAETMGGFFHERSWEDRPGADLAATYLSYFYTDVADVAGAYVRKFGVRAGTAEHFDTDALDRPLRDPLNFLRTDGWADLPVLRTVPQHGDLHGGNVMVDPQTGAAWLIDFGRSGVAHWARDFTQLEAAIRFLYQPIGSDDDRLQCDLHLTQRASLAEPPDGTGFRFESRQLLQLVGAIRGRAAAATAHLDPAEANREYLIALFATTMNYFRLHKLVGRRDDMRRLRITAGLLAERLDSGV